MIRYRLSASVLALVASSGFAQAEAFDLGTLTLYSSQVPLTLSESSSTVTVVEKEDLDEAPTTSVADYLSTVPGVSVATNGGVGGQSTLRLRGLSGKYVPVLINGIDVTDPSSTQTSFNWGGLTLGGVNRIEVLKGTQSAVYGSEAVGGVINITTLDPEAAPGTSGSWGFELGGNATKSGQFAIAHNGERAGLAFTANHLETSGISANAAGTEEDGFSGTQLTLEGYYDLTDTVRLGASLLYSRNTGEFDPFGGDGFAPYDQVYTSEVHAARLYAEFETGAVQNTLSYSTFTNDRTSTSTGRTDPFQGTREKVDYKGVWDINDDVTLSFGADWTREGFKTTEQEFLFDAMFNFLGINLLNTSEEIETLGVFSEVLWQPNDALSLSGSLRHDDHSEFGSFNSWRLGLAYDFGNDTVLRASAANGFRAPSLYELHSQLYGNATLEPETSRTFELGIEKGFANGFVSATLFYTEIEDLIGFVGAGYTQISGTSKSQGIELAGEYDVSDRLTVYGNYAYTDSEDANGNPLPRTPKHDVTLGLTADITDALSMGLTVQHLADRPQDGFPARDMDDYTLVNASVSYDIAPQTEMYLRVENLTDEDYQSVADYNTLGRTFFFGVRGSF
ncbi:TonB-dependent receptor plug domain-containing protein [Pacificoceanicola onchidii]|uniref:TonB-dependent receptor plug domain-containing protein n=1 Tax=Pacificoceanicola onchidii TaxID=2562685 RepID=UPI0010A32172|nr:TonB-dependent receptor [Pacificoceanicola onchidii]